MAIKFSNTRREASQHGVKMLVYGLPGSGKTYMLRTAPKPLIISSEAGLLSLRDVELPVITISGYDDLLEAYAFVTASEEMKKFELIALDSISEIAEVILAHEKTQATDPRRAYGELQTKTLSLCKSFRDIQGKHVLFNCKLERVQNENKVWVNLPGLPGNRLPQDMPYLFDEVFALRAEQDEEGVLIRKLQTQLTLDYVAKDRSGRLAMFEEPDLTAIITKIMKQEETAENAVSK